MLTFPTHRHSLKRNSCHKNIFFLLIILHLDFIDHIRKQTFERKKILHSFIQLTLNVFLIFDFEHVVREIRRKFVMEHVFCIDRDVKSQLCL